MGVILSYIRGNSGRTDDPDPITGLTSRDKYILSTTWKTLTTGQANLEMGMAIFLGLFEQHPEYQQLFPFRDVPYDQLKTNSTFHAHCISVMAGLSSLVDNVDCPEVLEQLLLKQGVNHIPRKVPRKAHEELKQVLIVILAKSLTPEQLATWEKFLTLGFSIILNGIDSVTKT